MNIIFRINGCMITFNIFFIKDWQIFLLFKSSKLITSHFIIEYVLSGLV